MYVPAHFKPDDDAVRELLRHIGAADLITATADGLLSTMLPLVHDEPGRPAGPRAVGRVAGPRGAEQRAVAGGAHRRGDGHHPRAGRVHLTGLVRDQARARPGGSRPGTTSPPTSTAGSSSTTIRPGSRRTSGALTAQHEADRRAALVGRRRAGGVHRRPAQGDRRRRDRHRPRRGQVQAQPEPLGRGHRRHDRGPRGTR